MGDEDEFEFEVETCTAGTCSRRRVEGGWVIAEVRTGPWGESPWVELTFVRDSEPR